MTAAPLLKMIETILRSSKRPLGAYDLAREVSLRTGRRCHANSVYRCLAVLSANGIARQIAVINKFIAFESTPPPNSFHVCSACQMVTAYLDRPTERLIRQTAQGAGFSPKRIIIECVGVCRDCSEAGP